jgi:Ca2+-transporting ATPase
MAVSGVHVNGFTDTAREIYYIKGSIETVLARCKFYYVSDESTPGLDAPTRSIITNKADSIAALGLRVVAMAYGYGSVESQNNGASANLIFVGFQAMMDPPRKGVSDSIALLQSGGVQVVMITGDAEQTALSIARQLGLLVGSGSSGCLTGRQMDEMDDRTLRDKVGGVCVFARTTPRHKMRIVAAYQSRGAVVAMTGDGGLYSSLCAFDIADNLGIVNDAPALKMADIGVSMGKSGTDVAKEAADVILVDDNFGTILSAVEEGRTS